MKKDESIIHKYVDRGWKLVPIPKGKKAPAGKSAKGWQTKHITDPAAIGDGNVGILLGEPSGWLIDIDLDWIEAAELSSSFLPDTGCIFGRSGKPNSHYLYTVSQARTCKYQLGKKDDGGMIVELRSTGGQTVFPPSVHPSGQNIEWEVFDEPSSISFAELEKACGILAAAAILSRHWGDGSRQDLSFAIAGMMLKVDYPEDEVVHFIQTIAEHTGDDEIEKRVLSVQRTLKAIEQDKDVAGFSGLVEILGEDTAKAISKFLKASQEEDIPEGSILITNTPSKDLATKAWDKLREGEEESSPTLFTFGEEIARIDGGIQVLTEKGFWQELASRTDWVRRDNKKVVHCDPPAGTITFMRNQRKSEINIPQLDGSTNTPIMAKDGSIHIDPGYGPSSKFYLFSTIEVPKISEKPKKAELAAAKELLEEVIFDFPFVHPSDKAHALAMIILPFIRPMIDGATPLHLLDKPVQGTGATLLAEAATAIKTGTALAAQAAPRTEEEWQKVILSKLMQAPEFLFLDNVRTIYSDTLAIALTASIYEGRRLGASEMLRVPIRCTWIMTGNNVEMGGDFPRRIIQIRLDANVEDPTSRGGFLHPDLHGWILEERGRLVWAILTAARAWIAAGRPPGKKEMASYNHWSLIMGGILEMLDVEGFLETPEERKKHIDPFVEAESEFIRCWLFHGIKDKEQKVMRSGELLNMCDSCELPFGFGSQGKDMNTMTFSKNRMNKIVDRVFNIVTMDDVEIPIKVTRSSLRGNGAWAIVPLGSIEGIDPDTIWQGLIWK